MLSPSVRRMATPLPVASIFFRSDLEPRTIWSVFVSNCETQKFFALPFVVKKWEVPVEDDGGGAVVVSVVLPEVVPVEVLPEVVPEPVLKTSVSGVTPVPET